MNPTTEQQREWAKRQAEKISGASRRQHDTLAYPPFFEHIFVAMVNSHLRGDVVAKSVQIGWDALLAEGTIHAPDENSVTQWQPFLAIPLLVGVGCGNAKKDTP